MRRPATNKVTVPSPSGAAKRWHDTGAADKQLYQRQIEATDQQTDRLVYELSEATNRSE